MSQPMPTFFPAGDPTPANDALPGRAERVPVSLRLIDSRGAAEVARERSLQRRLRRQRRAERARRASRSVQRSPLSLW